MEGQIYLKGKNYLLSSKLEIFFKKIFFINLKLKNGFKNLIFILKFNMKLKLINSFYKF